MAFINNGSLYADNGCRLHPGRCTDIKKVLTDGTVLYFGGCPFPDCIIGVNNPKMGDARPKLAKERKAKAEELWAKGRTVMEIARQLVVSPKTVNSYLKEVRGR